MSSTSWHWVARALLGGVAGLAQVAPAHAAPLLLGTFEPYQGLQRVAYFEGSEAVPLFGGESGDTFGLALRTSFGFVVPDIGGIFEASTLLLTVATGFTEHPSTAVNLFGPGPPSAFIWADPTPGVCSPLCDTHHTFGGVFSHSRTVSGVVSGQFRATTVDDGGNLVFSRVTLAPVPEPGLLTLVALALGTVGWRGSRRRRT